MSSIYSAYQLFRAFDGFLLHIKRYKTTTPCTMSFGLLLMDARMPDLRVIKSALVESQVKHLTIVIRINENRRRHLSLYTHVGMATHLKNYVQNDYHKDM